jgi:hypothetical protein
MVKRDEQKSTKSLYSETDGVLANRYISSDEWLILIINIVK